MNTKKMIAVMAVLAMAVAAFAVIPAGEISGDDSKIVELKGDFTSQLTLTSEQTVVVVDDLNIIDGGYLEILGDFTVKEGKTVTIEGAKADGSANSQLVLKGDATIDGTIISKTGDKTDSTKAGLIIKPEANKEVVINGTVSAIGNTSGDYIKAVVCDALTTNTGAKITVNGNVVIGTNATACMERAEFAEKSLLTVYGELIVGLTSGEKYIKTSGNVFIDGKATAMIRIANPTAVIEVKSVEGTISVTDDQMLAYTYGGIQYYVNFKTPTAIEKKAVTEIAEKGKTDTEVAANSITLENVENVKVTETVTTSIEYDEKTSQNMMVAATETVISTLDAQANVTAAATAGTINVTVGITTYIETMTLVDVSIDVATATVRGDVTLTKCNPAISFKVGSNLTVDGLVLLKGTTAGTPATIDSEAYVSAAKYTVKNDENIIDTYYTTLERAIKDGAQDIDMKGILKVEKDIEIPAPVKISASKVTIEKGAKLTIDSGAKFTATTVDSNGSFEIMNINSGITLGTVYADVKLQDDAYVLFTNVYVAFEKAVSGDKINAYNPVENTIVIDEDLILPAGVTFYNVNEDTASAAAGEKSVRVDNGATFTIAGKLLIASGDSLYTNANGWNTKTPAVDSSTGEVKDYSVIIIGANGMIVFESAHPSEGFYGEHKVAGAYFTTDNYAKYCITNIAYAFENILDADSNCVEIAKENTIENLKVTGTEKERIIVKFLEGSKTTFKGFTFAYGTAVFIMGSEEAPTTVTGDIGTATGKMTFDGAVIGGGRVVFEEKYINDAMNLTVNGGEIKSEKETIVSGTVFFNNLKYTAIGTNESVKDFEDMRLTVAAGAKLFITGITAIQYAEVYILGDVVVTNTGVFSGNTTSVVSVIGTMTVEKIDGKAGKANFYRYVVGGSSNDLFTYNRPDTVGTAVLGGQGTFNDSANPFALIVAGGATVSADVLVDWMAADSTKNTEFYMDGKLWATVYIPADYVTVPAAGVAIMTTNADGVTYPNIVPTLDNVDFVGWQTYDEKTKTYTTITPAKGTTAWVGQAGLEKVYADLTKEIYTINVNADQGIDNVYIDGVLMTKTVATNSYTADVAAGTHTLSYTLANGYSGNAVITSIDGAKLVGGGLSFVVNDDKYDGPMDITLSGIQKSGYDVDPETHEEKSTGLTVTEILLIVVVVIMAIMAIVLIMRLNRS